MPPTGTLTTGTKNLEILKLRICMRRIRTLLRNIPFARRVDGVIDWLQLPEADRPSWISLYFDEPDHTAHDQGPESGLV